MTTYYVATLARYVLVVAENETQAREMGHVALRELDAHLPPNIVTVRLATSDESDLLRWHQDMLAREAACQQR